MRDRYGHHVSALDSHGLPEDVDGVHVHTSIRGSFVVTYAAHIDKVCVDVERWGGPGDMTMQLTIEQATLLRDLVDAGIADALAAKAAVAEADPAPMQGIDNDVDGITPINDHGTFCVVCSGQILLAHNGGKSRWMHELYPGDDHDAVPAGPKEVA